MNSERTCRRWGFWAASCALVALAGCPAATEKIPPAAVNGSSDKPNLEPLGNAKPPGDAPIVNPPATDPPPAAAAGDKPAAGYGEQPELTAKPKKTPVDLNGEFFVGWEKPKLAILITGRQDGYLEPCGCAGLENQKGGIGRRHSLIKELRDERGWPLVCVDVGGLVRRFGRQAELQFGNSAKALTTMGYSAVGFGASDLRLSTGEIVAAAVGDDPNQKGVFVSANVKLFGDELVPRVRKIDVAGIKLGITSIFSETLQKEVNNTEITFLPVKEGLEKAVADLADCNYRILLAHATVDETVQLARDFPQFDVVVTAEGPDEPPYEMSMVGRTPLVKVGHKGMYSIVLGLDDSGRPPRYQRVALDARYQVTPEMLQVMANLQDQLHELGWDGLGVTPKPLGRPGGAPGASRFVGSESCRECHSAAFDIWSKTGHAHATASLEHAKPPRQFDPECVSCHMTGWSPQEFFPWVSGYDSMKTTPHLIGNGCENCHGPGEAHNLAEKGSDVARRDAERAAMRLSVETVSQNVCLKCHDHDNSPDYNFDKYWERIAH